MIVCDRCRKELRERVIVKRDIKIFFVLFSESKVICRDCLKDFDRFMEPVKEPPKERNNG